MRVWTFGCSFTDYFYPTWADLLIHEAEQLGYSGNNWGSIGKGNLYIASKIQECHARNTLGPNDWVFVCWSSFYREDSYDPKKGWGTPKYVFQRTSYNDGTVNGFASREHYFIRDLSLVQSTQLALKALGVNQLHWSILPLLGDDKYSKIYSNLKFDAPDMMSALGLVVQDDTKKSTRIKTHPPGDPNDVLEEWHPLPLEHYNFLDSFIINKVSWINTLSKETKDLATSWHNKLFLMPQPADLGKTGWKKRTVNEW